MEPSTYTQPQSRPSIVPKLIIGIVIVVIVAAAAFFIIRAVHQQTLVNEVKTELVKQNKLLRNAAKSGLYPATLPAGIKTTNDVIISASVSATGTTYCIDGTSKKDAKISYHMTKDTGDNEAQKGSCNESVTSPPPVPADFSVGSVGAGDVSLMWSAAPFAASYTVQCSTDSKFIADLKVQTVKTTTASVGDLTSGVQYYCRVAASNTLGQSAWSDSVTATVDAVSVAPKNLKITTISRSSLGYSWDAVPGALSYILEYSPDISFVNDVQRITVTATSGTVTNLKSYTGYDFHVKAVTAAFDADHAAFSETQLGRTSK